MTFIRQAKGLYLFQLGRREKGLLLHVLSLYPRIPSAYQQLSKSKGPDDSCQKLLDESLAEQRAENKRHLDALLKESHRFVEHEKGWRLALSAAELEWLLQILNDIRVGSWVSMGSPEIPFETITQRNAPHIWAMELAGTFQMGLLTALGT